MDVALTTKVPGELQAKLQEEFGCWDDGVEAAVVRVLGASSPEEFLDAERGVHAMMRTRADALVAAALKYRAGAAEFVEPCRDRAHERAAAEGASLKSNGTRATRVQLLGGTTVSIETLRLRPVAKRKAGRPRGVGRRGKAGTGFYPVLAELGITGLATPALMAEVAREVAESNSVQVARASLRERGLNIPHKSALRLTWHMAERALAVRTKQVAAAAVQDAPESGEFAGLRIVVSMDGGRVRIRENPIAGRRNAKTRHRKYQAPWREPKVMTIYAIDEAGERDKRSEVFIDATVGDADYALALLVGHLRLRGAHLAEHVTLTGDGADWIWGRAQKLRAAIGVPPERFTEVVDYYHACEHLHAVAAIPKGWEQAERTKWVKAVEKDLYAGRIDKVLTAIEALRVGRRGTAIGKCTRYFSEHRERMRYADLRARGLPMGSGAVESAVRRVVNLRMKGNSIFWLPEHAEGMLHLRAHLKAGRWDDLVRATIRTPVWSPPP